MSDENERSVASAGSVAGEPVAWLVAGEGYEYATLLREHADAIASEGDAVVVPLYRSPTLTDAEREAVRWFACYGVDRPLGHSTTLRGLLERLQPEVT